MAASMQTNANPTSGVLILHGFMSCMIHVLTEQTQLATVEQHNAGHSEIFTHRSRHEDILFSRQENYTNGILFLTVILDGYRYENVLGLSYHVLKKY